MEPSDWIAAGALGVSAIALFASVLVSVVGFWFNYRTNKVNIRARRAEIVTEKSIEVYREVVKKLIDLIGSMQTVNWEEFIQAKKEFYTFCLDHRLYFPTELNNQILDYADRLTKLIIKNENETVTLRRERFDEALKDFEIIVESIQEHIGLEFGGKA